MAGDYSSNEHLLRWRGTGANRLETQSEEIVLPGDINEIIVAADSDDWHFTGEFCIEVFGAKFDNNTNNHGMISQYNASDNQRSWSINYRAELTPKVIRAAFSTNGSGLTSFDTDEFIATVGQAYDIAVERDSSNDIRVYIDGVMRAKQNLSGALHNSTDRLEVGMGFEKTSNAWAGRLKAVRITKAARYADDGGYTVPDLPLPTS